MVSCFCVPNGLRWEKCLINTGTSCRHSRLARPRLNLSKHSRSVWGIREQAITGDDDWFIGPQVLPGNSSLGGGMWCGRLQQGLWIPFLIKLSLALPHSIRCCFLHQPLLGFTAARSSLISAGSQSRRSDIWSESGSRRRERTPISSFWRGYTMWTAAPHLPWSLWDPVGHALLTWTGVVALGSPPAADPADL